MELTALGRAVVLARSGSTRAGTTRLLDAQGPALVDLTLETLLGSVGLVRGNHLDEAEAARLLRVRVAHDVALLNLTILLEQTCNLLLGQTGVDTGDEEIGARVAAAIVSARLGGRTTVSSSTTARVYPASQRQHLPAIASVGRGAAGARVVHVATITARRPTAVAVVATGLVCASVSKLCKAQRACRIGRKQTIIGTLVLLVLHGGHDDT